jgi:NifU-like protein
MKSPFSYPLSVSYEEPFYKKSHLVNFLGSFDDTEAKAKDMKLCAGYEESQTGDRFKLFILVDKSDGVIADVRFKLYAKSCFYLVLEALCELILLKSYPQALKVSAALIESKLKKDVKKPLPKGFDEAINLSLFALDEALKSCSDIPVDEKELITPLENGESSFEVPNWMNLELKTQLHILEEVIAKDIRPYIELDEGGIEIVSLKEGIFLTIGYKGACTTCHASTGSTLTAIQQILRSKVFPALVVIPDASWLSREDH